MGVALRELIKKKGWGKTEKEREKIREKKIERVIQAIPFIPQGKIAL